MPSKLKHADRRLKSPSSSDEQLLLALQRHGVLCTRFLNRYHGGCKVDYTCKRLGHLRHRSLQGYGKLIRLADGEDVTHHRLNNDNFYTIADAGKKWLKDNNMWEDAIKPTGWFPHQMMIGAVTASIELESRNHGIEFIPGHHILNGKPLPYSTAGKKLIPDQLFQLKYPNGTYRTFAVECDRGNEAIEQTARSIRHKNKTLESAYLQYRAFIGTRDNRPYQQHYGIKSGLLVLNVMTSVSKMIRYMDLIGSCQFMLFQHVHGFKRNFRTPFFLPNLLNDEWLRAGCDALRID